jgi:hypothetical protein
VTAARRHSGFFADCLSRRRPTAVFAGGEIHRVGSKNGSHAPQSRVKELPMRAGTPSLTAILFSLLVAASLALGMSVMKEKVEKGPGPLAAQLEDSDRAAP